MEERARTKDARQEPSDGSPCQRCRTTMHRLFVHQSADWLALAHLRSLVQALSGAVLPARGLSHRHHEGARRSRAAPRPRRLRWPATKPRASETGTCASMQHKMHDRASVHTCFAISTWWAVRAISPRCCGPREVGRLARDGARGAWNVQHSSNALPHRQPQRQVSRCHCIWHFAGRIEDRPAPQNLRNSSDVTLTRMQLHKSK